MSRFPEALAAALLLVAAPALALELDSLGRAPTEEEIAAWDIDVRPDGQGLPKGSMSVADGEAVFIEKCASCHGDFAEGVGRWPVLAGGQGTLKKARPVKTVGSYWPYLSTAWDYIHRAMPFGGNLTLTDDEVYGTVAYILYMNDVVTDPEFVLSDENFLDVRLPNEDGFVDDPRPDTPAFEASAPCMENCKESVEVTMRATVLDVTPDEEGAADADSGVTETDARPLDAAEAEPELAAASGEAAGDPAADAAAAEPDPALVEAGEKVFRKCKACHMVGEGAKNRVGPHLNDILGRAAGAVEGFRYSDPLLAKAEEGLVWDHEALDAFLADPKGYLPGTKMSFAGLKDEDDRRAVAAYLQAAGK